MNRTTLTLTKILVLAGMLGFAVSAPGALLSPEEWKLTSSDGSRMKAAADNNLDTVWTSELPQKTGLAVTIDLGRETVVHRVYLNPGKESANFPRSLKLLTGNQLDQCQAFLERRLFDARETSIKFNPVRARYLRLEIGSDGSGLPWSIAELELYGSADKEAMAKGDAVVVATNAPAPLRLAAEELRYYVGELTGKPLPIVSPAETNDYPGILFRVVDQGPFPTYAAYQQARETGRIVETIHVNRNGREVLFDAWPYANVVYSVWEFLGRQGVRWLYPSPQGDYVPAGKGVDLSGLPFTFKPSAEDRHASWNAMMYNSIYGARDEYLWYGRNGWCASYNPYEYLGGSETPTNPARVSAISFGGAGHTFNQVVPEAVLKEHPDWCGYSQKAGKRLLPSQGGPSFCVSNPELIAYVVKRVIDSVKGNPEADGWVSLCPMDAANWCECESCRQLDEPRVPETLAYCTGPLSVADSYFAFVAAVAQGLQQALPRVKVAGLAYADYHQPPRKIAKMPDNVEIRICQYGARNLPVASLRNAEMMARMNAWREKAKALKIWDYALIHTESYDLRMPVPLVTAFVDRLGTYQRMGALSGNVQASAATWPYSPWNFYAYSRLFWKADSTAGEILNDFFGGYYREAKAPMLQYYRTLEDHLIKNDIDLQRPGSYDYVWKPAAFPPEVVSAMHANLQGAERMAQYWLTKERVRTARMGFQWTLDKLAIRQPR